MNLHQLRQRKAELRSSTSAIIAAPGGTDGLLTDEQRTTVNEGFAELDRLQANETILERQAHEDGEARGRPLNDRETDDGMEYRVFPGATSRTTATDFTTWRLPNGEHVPVLSREQRIADFLPTERTAADEIGLGGFMKALVNGPRNDLERRVLAEGSVSAGGAMVPAALAAQVLDAARIRNVAFQAGAMTMPMPAVQTQMAKIVSDVRFMSHETIAGGRIRLDQSKTNNAVDVPVVEPLSDALAAGPLGASLLLETKDGAAFTPKGFYGMMKKACIAAGIPHCSPHGLRKSAARRCREAGCSDDEGMAITGHKSVREYRRYAGEDARGARADTAMGKVMANRASKLAREAKETIDDAA